MKILIVNTYDMHGGAARAAQRLHKALLNENVDSRMLVKTKTGDDHTVVALQSKIQKLLSVIRPRLEALLLKPYENRTKTYFSPAFVPFSGMAEQINALNPDIVHLHWVCGGMTSIEDIGRIRAPIVWTLHDDWPFTGGCHVRFECEKYMQKCGACPALSSEKERDLSRRIYNRKLKVFPGIRKLTLIGLSRWMVECVTKSSLFRNRTVRHIPNPLDTTVYAPVPKHEARALLRLPLDKKLILFGAINATGDARKGFTELSQALEKIRHEDIELMVFGSSAPENPPHFKFRSRYFGQLHDDIALRLLYSAADVMVVPSLQETFGQTAVEAMACGTPVVAFGHTGLLDIVDHKINGYLAKPFDTSDLAKGIEWVLANENYGQLCSAGREKAVATFDSHVVAKQVIGLYEEILSTSHNAS